VDDDGRRDLGSIGLFFVLPVLLTSLTDRFVESAIASNAIEKAIRLVLLLGYMWAIGQMPTSSASSCTTARAQDDQRLRGRRAAHARVGDRVPIEHPRCGTTFLLIVMLISFFAFSLLGRPSLEIRIASPHRPDPLHRRHRLRVHRWSGARYKTSALVRALAAPRRLAVQKLTTREPDLDQCAVAIAALEPVLAAEEPQAAEPELVAALAAAEAPAYS